VKTVSDKVVKHSLTSVRRLAVAKNSATDPIRYLFVALQPQHLAKKVQLTILGNPLRAFQWTVYVDPKLLKKGSTTQSIQNLNTNLR